MDVPVIYFFWGNMMKFLTQLKTYISLLAISLSFACSNLSPTAVFNDNSFSGKISKIVDFDSVELKPTAQIGLIIDNSSSMQEEQKKMADGIEKMVQSLQGYNVDIYTISTTALKGTHRINTAGDHANGGAHLLKGEDGFYQYNPITPIIGTTDQYFTKPFMAIEDIVVTDDKNEVRNYTPKSFENLREGETLPWKINFKTNTLPSATNNGKPFQVLAEMNDSEVSGIAANIREEIRAFGTNGSPHNYGACALYKMARDMMPAGKTTSFFLISDEEDKSNYAIDRTAYRSGNFEQLASNKHSYCSESSEIAIEINTANRGTTVEVKVEDTEEITKAQKRINLLEEIVNKRAGGDASKVKVGYKNMIIRFTLEYTGLQEINGSNVYGTYVLTYKECLHLGSLCDKDYIGANDPAYNLSQSDIITVMNFNNSVNNKVNEAARKIKRIDSAKITRLEEISWGTLHMGYHTEDRRVNPFTRGEKDYDNIFDYYNQSNDAAGYKALNSMTKSTSIAYYPDSSGYYKTYKRSKTSFADAGLVVDLSKGDTTFSSSLGDMFITEANAKFPAFSFSAIIHDPTENEGKNCGNGPVQHGTVYRDIAEKVVGLNTKSLGKVNSICGSNYDEYINEIKDSFIVKNASLSYHIDAPITDAWMSSLALINEANEKISLKLTNDISKLDQYDVAAVGESLTFNKEALQKVLGINSISSEAFKGYKIDVTFSPIK